MHGGYNPFVIKLQFLLQFVTDNLTLAFIQWYLFYMVRVTIFRGFWISKHG